VPPATKDEAQRYVDAHPEMFAQRKIFILDQIQMPRPSDPAVIKAMEPLKTFDQIEALLNQNKIPFKQNSAALDVLGADPRVVDAIQKLPPGELFVLPQGQLLTVNQVKDTKIQPVPADKAVPIAQQLVTRQRTEEAIRKRFQQLFSDRAKTVKFSKEFAAMNPLGTGAAAKPAGAPATRPPSPAGGATAGSAPPSSVGE
jgi:hypothetical protein